MDGKDAAVIAVALIITRISFRLLLLLPFNLWRASEWREKMFLREGSFQRPIEALKADPCTCVLCMCTYISWRKGKRDRRSVGRGLFPFQSRLLSSCSSCSLSFFSSWKFTPRRSFPLLLQTETERKKGRNLLLSLFTFRILRWYQLIKVRYNNTVYQ